LRRRSRASLNLIVRVQIVASASANYFRRFYFSIEGRIGRRAYWLFMVLPAFLVGVVLGFVSSVPPVSSRWPVAIVILIAPLLIWIGGAVSIKRLHDFGFNGWCVLVCFIPYVNFAATIILGIVPTQLRANAYGEIPFRVSAKL
jgi:uncharacterized membrane protein YhaH (DUF805 family)